ncbi:MAG: HNH endonuclease [Candidatus Sulfotelmatobacter sp.]
MANIEVHHKEFRSHSGEDSEINLITLCMQCHSRAHGGHDPAPPWPYSRCVGCPALYRVGRAI